MLKVLFTLDYEIHGTGEGDPDVLMVAPTRRMLDLFDQYGAKLTIMVDVAEILKFKEYQESTGRDDYHYHAIVDQLRDAVRRGHDVQLHIHSSYFNARHENGRWLQDWSEYQFAGLPQERMNEMVRQCKQLLEHLIRPVKKDYRCFVFRAANWSVSPSRNVVRALLANGITMDTSVFKHGRREGIVSFDYSNAHSELVPWPVDEQDVCRRDETGTLIEVPIYCERRWIGAFMTPQRFYRAKMTNAHRVGKVSGLNGEFEPAGTNGKPNRLKKLTRLFSRHPWKADFNQCSGRQLIRALERACAKHDGEDRLLPFVLIGHSKLFTKLNELSLKPFLAHVAGDGGRFGFGTFADFERQIAVGQSRVAALL